MDNKNKNNGNLQTPTTNKSYGSMSMSEKLEAADKAKEDARNQYQNEENFLKKRESSEKEKLDLYKNQSKKDIVPQKNDTPLTTRTDAPKTKEPPKEKGDNREKGDHKGTRDNNGKGNGSTKPIRSDRNGANNGARSTNNSPTMSQNTTTTVPNATTTPSQPIAEKVAGGNSSRNDAQKQYEEAERLRRQREASAKAKNNHQIKRNRRNAVSLAMVLPPTARRIEPPRVRESNAKMANRMEIANIKNQARMASKPNSKLTLKKALGRSAKGVATNAKDLASVSGNDYAAADFTKKKIENVASKVVKSAGLDKVANVGKEGVSLITSQDVSKDMTELSLKIATKGAGKVVRFDKTLRERALKKVEKQTKIVDKLDRKYDKLNKKELNLREKADKNYSKADKCYAKAEKKSKNPEKSKKLKEKGDRLNEKGNKRSSKADKARDKRSKKNQKLGAKREKATTRLNKAREKARKRTQKDGIVKSIAKKIIKPAAIAFAVPILIVSVVSALAGGVGSAGAFMASKFVSDVCDFLSLEWTSTGKELAMLENMNWAQYIADNTAISLGETFTDTAKKDAQVHYANKRVTLSSALNQLNDKSYPRYDWFCDLGEGSIGRVWMREQCDNITDKNGQTIYNTDGEPKGSTSLPNMLYLQNGVLSQMALGYGYDMKYYYEPQENNRLTITPNANIVPILSLAHDRYTEEWTWENYEVVMAYVWYMYTLSHNVAHYDVGSNYNNPKGDEGAYSYVTQQMCDKSIFSSSSYLSKFNYDRSSLALSRPETKEISCTNVFVHGYDKDSIFGDAGFKEKVKDKAKGVAKKVLSWVDSLVEWATDEESDLAESVMQAGTYYISYDRDSSSGYVSSGTKYYAKFNDKSFTSTTANGTSQILGGVANGYGTTVYCDNVQYKQKDNSVVCGHSVHDHSSGCVCSKEVHDHTSGCVYSRCGKSEHDHTSGCSYTKCGLEIHKHDASCGGKEVLVCNLPIVKHSHTFGDSNSYCYNYIKGTWNCSIVNHETHTAECYELQGKCNKVEHVAHTKECCAIAEHKHVNACCEKSEHKKHNATCCTIKHTTHKEWNGVNDPGCYDTFAYCGGHCGGHISPSVNIAVTYTMEGLAYQDAVALKAETSAGKDSSWTGSQDFIRLFEKLEKVSSLREWSQVTSEECNQWFKPGPNGPVSALCYAGECLYDFKMTVFRGWRDFWKGVGDWILGSDDDKAPEYNDVAADQDKEELDKLKNEFDGNGENDDHNFEGWFEDTGYGLTFKENLFDELHELYGDPDDFYAAGVRIWKDFNVQFRVGFGHTYVSSDIEKILGAIRSKYYPTNELALQEQNQNRLKIIEKALAACGYFNYSEKAVYNGSSASMGAANSLGFVSTICKRAFGDECGFGTGGIVNKIASSVTDPTKVGCAMVSSISNIKPGDILVQVGEDAALIYIGYFTDPISGITGHYVVDCVDSTTKISWYHQIQESQLKKYYQYYRPTPIK